MKKLRSILTILTTATLLFTNAAWSGDYNYYPESWLTLGAGLNPYRPTRDHRKCIASQGEQKADGPGSRHSIVTIEMLKRKEDFYQLVNFSASLAGSYKFFSGSASYRYEQEDAFHEDSLTWIVFFRRDFGIFELKNPRLDSEFANLTERELYDTCGTEIVTKQKKSAMAFALFTLKNLTSSKRQEIESSLKAAGKGVVWDASASASYSSILQSALAVSQMSVKIWTVGEKTETPLGQFIGPQNNEDQYAYFSRIPHALKSVVDNMVEGSAAPVAFKTMPISSFKPGLRLTLSEFNAGNMGRLYSLYDRAESVVNRIETILSGVEADEYDLSSETKVQLQNHLKSYSTAMKDFEAAAKLCFEPSSKCEVPDMTQKMGRASWPAKKPKALSRCERVRQDAIESQCTDLNYYKYAVDQRMIPLCTSYIKGGKGQLIGWKPCAE